MEEANTISRPDLKQTVHDLGNRLAVIRGCLELVANSPADSSRWIDRARTATSHARELAAKLREVA